MDTVASLSEVCESARRTPEIGASLEVLALANSSSRGAVFTKREVVDFILDVSGYRVGSSLVEKRLLEPSFGGGDFVIPVIERLLDDYFGGDKKVIAAKEKHSAHINLGPCIRAVELHVATSIETRSKIKNLLLGRGFLLRHAEVLLDQWLITDDFLLTSLPETFDCVVGNPPYVRQELIPDVLLREYRCRYRTLYDRADLYVPFMERCLGLLNQGGKLGFICSDRWMKNKYGGPLRRLIAEGGYRLSTYVDMVGTEAFQSEVIAYTAVTVIDRCNIMGKEAVPIITRVARRPEVNASSLANLASALSSPSPTGHVDVSEVINVARADEPWLLDVNEEVETLRELERKFPLLEDAGGKVGIGVATGYDRAYIGIYEDLPIEPSRKIPLVMARDLVGGEITWNGMGIVNPFEEDGTVVALDRFPRFGAYIRAHQDKIAARHVAKRNPERWYRTIDRIYPSLTKVPKLLIPDIKGEANVVYDEGRFYPHHNLYFITSDQWEMRALQAVLRSAVARLFVRLYSVQMRGGFLRFQAQYLRRIRLPLWAEVPGALRIRLSEAGRSLNQEEIDASVSTLYGLTKRAMRAAGTAG